MKKRWTALLTAFLLLLSGCAAAPAGGTEPAEPVEVTEPAEPAAAPAEVHKVIIDTDCGADDAAAIAMAAASPAVEILGVTTLYGNVPLQQAAANALMTMELCGCDAPAYIGAEGPLVKEYTFTGGVMGEDGMGDQDLIHPAKQAAEGSAVDFILNTIRANPGEVEIIAIGPLTNIAQAIEKDPETMRQVKKVWVMGTAGFGPGNATPVADFNVFSDAEAYDVFLKAELPALIIGLDCEKADSALTAEDLARLAEGNELGRYMAKAFTVLFQFYQGNGENMGIPDGTAVAALIWPECVEETVRCHGIACVSDEVTYGQVVFYREDKVYDSTPEIEAYNLDVVSRFNGALFKERFMDLMTEE